MSVVLFATNCLFAHSQETNFWKERENSIQLASLPAVAGLPGNILKSSSFPNASIGNPSWIPASAGMTALSARRLNKWLKGAKDNQLNNLISSFPASFGTIRGVSIPQNGTGRIMIHIQDVHMNTEAQENIGKVIQDLTNQSRIDLVALEGAFTPIDLSPFREFPHQNVVKDVADYLLKENKISGPIHAAFMSSKPFPSIAGIDDESHYNANVEAYKKSTGLKEAEKTSFESMDRELKTRKAAAFSKDLLTFDANVRLYRDGTLSMGEYTQLLARHVGTVSSDIDVFLEAFALEKSLNFTQVEAERSALINQLVKKLNPAQVQELLQLSSAFRLGQLNHADFYQALRELCASAGVDLARYKSMNAYVQYVLLADSVNAEKLSSELKTLEDVAYESLAKSETEKRLIWESRQLYLIGKLLDFALTKEEWREYKKASPPTVETWGGDSLQSFEKFYLEAEARDKAMFTNLLKAMDAKKAKVAVLVTGGFHSEGMGRLANDAGLTTIDFVPKITRLRSPEANEGGQATDMALSVFTREKTPLEKLFEGQKLFLAGAPISGPVRTGACLTIAGNTVLREASLANQCKNILERSFQMKNVTFENVKAGLVYVSGALQSQKGGTPFKVSVSLDLKMNLVASALSTPVVMTILKLLGFSFDFPSTLGVFGILLTFFSLLTSRFTKWRWAMVPVYLPIPSLATAGVGATPGAKSFAFPWLVLMSGSDQSQVPGSDPNPALKRIIYSGFLADQIQNKPEPTGITLRAGAEFSQGGTGAPIVNVTALKQRAHKDLIRSISDGLKNSWPFLRGVGYHTDVLNGLPQDLSFLLTDYTGDVFGVSSEVSHQQRLLADMFKKLIEERKENSKSITLTFSGLGLPASEFHSTMRELLDILKAQVSPESLQHWSINVNCVDVTERVLEGLALNLKTGLEAVGNIGGLKINVNVVPFNMMDVDGFRENARALGKSDIIFMRHVLYLANRQGFSEIAFNPKEDGAKLNLDMLARIFLFFQSLSILARPGTRLILEAAHGFGNSNIPLESPYLPRWMEEGDHQGAGILTYSNRSMPDTLSEFVQNVRVVPPHPDAQSLNNSSGEASLFKIKAAIALRNNNPVAAYKFLVDPKTIKLKSQLEGNTQSEQLFRKAEEGMLEWVKDQKSLHQQLNRAEDYENAETLLIDGLYKLGFHPYSLIFRHALGEYYLFRGSSSVKYIEWARKELEIALNFSVRWEKSISERSDLIKFIERERPFIIFALAKVYARLGDISEDLDKKIFFHRKVIQLLSDDNGTTLKATLDDYKPARAELIYAITALARRLADEGKREEALELLTLPDKETIKPLIQDAPEAPVCLARVWFERAGKKSDSLLVKARGLISDDKGYTVLPKFAELREAFILLAKIDLALKEPWKALAAIIDHRTQQLKPILAGNRIVLWLLTRAYMAEEKWDKAEEINKIALREFPDNPRFAITRAFLIKRKASLNSLLFLALMLPSVYNRLSAKLGEEGKADAAIGVASLLWAAGEGVLAGWLVNHFGIIPALAWLIPLFAAHIIFEWVHPNLDIRGPPLRWINLVRFGVFALYLLFPAFGYSPYLALPIHLAFDVLQLNLKVKWIPVYLPIPSLSTEGVGAVHGGKLFELPWLVLMGASANPNQDRKPSPTENKESKGEPLLVPAEVVMARDIPRWIFRALRVKPEPEMVQEFLTSRTENEVTELFTQYFKRVDDLSSLITEGWNLINKFYPPAGEKILGVELLEDWPTLVRSNPRKALARGLSHALAALTQAQAITKMDRRSFFEILSAGAWMLLNLTPAVKALSVLNLWEDPNNPWREIVRNWSNRTLEDLVNRIFLFRQEYLLRRDNYPKDRPLVLLSNENLDMVGSRALDPSRPFNGVFESVVADPLGLGNPGDWPSEDRHLAIDYISAALRQLENDVGQSGNYIPKAQRDLVRRLAHDPRTYILTPPRRAERMRDRWKEALKNLLTPPDPRVRENLDTLSQWMSASLRSGQTQPLKPSLASWAEALRHSDRAPLEVQEWLMSFDFEVGIKALGGQIGQELAGDVEAGPLALKEFLHLLQRLGNAFEFTDARGYIFNRNPWAEDAASQLRVHLLRFLTVDHPELSRRPELKEIREENRGDIDAIKEPQRLYSAWQVAEAALFNQLKPRLDLAEYEDAIPLLTISAFRAWSRYQASLRRLEHRFRPNHPRKDKGINPNSFLHLILMLPSVYNWLVTKIGEKNANAVIGAVSLIGAAGEGVLAAWLANNFGIIPALAWLIPLFAAHIIFEGVHPNSAIRGPPLRWINLFRFGVFALYLLFPVFGTSPYLAMISHIAFDFWHLRTGIDRDVSKLQKTFELLHSDKHDRISHPEKRGGTHFVTWIYQEISLVEKISRSLDAAHSVRLARENLGGYTVGFDYLEENGNVRVLMESVPSLADVIQKLIKSDQLEKAKELLRKYFDVNLNIIKRGVVNWDPKLENYGVNEKGEVRLIDLGGLVEAQSVLDVPESDDSDIFYFNSKMSEGVPAALSSTFNQLREEYGFGNGTDIFQTIKKNANTEPPERVKWKLPMLDSGGAAGTWKIKGVLALFGVGLLSLQLGFFSLFTPALGMLLTDYPILWIPVGILTYASTSVLGAIFEQAWTKRDKENLSFLTLGKRFLLNKWGDYDWSVVCRSLGMAPIWGFISIFFIYQWVLPGFFGSILGLSLLLQAFLLQVVISTLITDSAIFFTGRAIVGRDSLLKIMGEGRTKFLNYLGLNMIVWIPLQFGFAYLREIDSPWIFAAIGMIGLAWRTIQVYMFEGKVIRWLPNTTFLNIVTLPLKLLGDLLFGHRYFVVQSITCLWFLLSLSTARAVYLLVPNFVLSVFVVPVACAIGYVTWLKTRAKKYILPKDAASQINDNLSQTAMRLGVGEVLANQISENAEAHSPLVMRDLGLAAGLLSSKGRLRWLRVYWAGLKIMIKTFSVSEVFSGHFGRLFRAGFVLGEKAGIYTDTDWSWLVSANELNKEVQPVIDLSNPITRAAEVERTKLIYEVLKNAGKNPVFRIISSDEMADRAQFSAELLSSIKFISAETAVLSEETVRYFNDVGFLKSLTGEEVRRLNSGGLAFAVITQDLDMSRISEENKQAFVVAFVLGHLVAVMNMTVVSKLKRAMAALIAA